MTDRNYILHIDDDPDDLFTFREALSLSGSPLLLKQELEAINALSYLRSIRNSNLLPAMIIVDLNMPRISGKDFLGLIAQEPWFPKVPTVALTTSSLPADKAFCEQLGVLFRTKPSLFEGFRVLVQDLLLLSQSTSIAK